MRLSSFLRLVSAALTVALLALACEGTHERKAALAGSGLFVGPQPLSGDVSCNGSTCTVSKVNGSSVPAGGALTTGNVLQASGASATTYAPVNLAGGAGFVTGALPTGNQAAQSVTLTGDTTCSGTTASCVTTTGKINGATVPGAGALTTGNVLQVSGASATTYAAVNLAGGSSFVTGVLPAANLGAISLSGDVSCSAASGGALSSCNVTAISGSTPIAVTPNVIQWTKGTATPTLTQAAPTSDVATVPLLISAQPPFASASTNKTGGNLDLAVASPVAGGNDAYVCTQQGTSNTWQFGYQFGGTTNYAIYPGGVTPSSSNYNIAEVGNTTVINAPNTVSLNTAGTGRYNATGSSFAPAAAATYSLGASGSEWTNTFTNALTLSGPLSGSSTVPARLATSGSTIACGTGGTQTISAAQAGNPGLVATSGTLSSNCVIDFGTNATSGIFFIDMSGVTVGATFGVQFKNGTATSTILSGGVPSGDTLAIVFTHGANTLAVQY